MNSNNLKEITLAEKNKILPGRFVTYWRKFGPGFITGAADDDPSGIATYSQVGSQFKFRFVWLALFTTPLMISVQEMCARLGMVTGRGLAENIRRHFPRWVLYLCVSLLFIANTFNIGADFGAMSAAVQLLAPQISFSFLVIAFALLSLVLQIFVSYRLYATYLKYLTFTLFSYIITGFIVGLPWKELFQALVWPQMSFTKDQVLLVCGILGTTISPYLFFWQSSQEVEEEILSGRGTLATRQGVNKEEIRDMRIDVWSGMLISNIVMFFVIAVCGATLYTNGITNITTAADAALALKPLAGNAAFLLFALGIVGVGLLGIPVLAGSASYAVAESFKWKEGLYRKFREAHAFYGVIIASMGIGLLLNFVHLDPIKALIYAAILNGIIAPVLLVFIVILSGNKKIMGDYVNGFLATFLGWITIIFMGIIGLASLALIFGLI